MVGSPSVGAMERPVELVGVTEEARTDPYEVTGFTSEQLKADVIAKMPSRGARRFESYTEWYVRWEFDFDEKPGACSLKAPKVTLGVVRTLPRWQRPGLAAPEAVVKWEAYTAALGQQALAHRNFGARAANGIAAMLAMPHQAATCAAAEAKANGEGNAILDEHRRKEAAYQPPLATL